MFFPSNRIEFEVISPQQSHSVVALTCASTSLSIAERLVPHLSATITAFTESKENRLLAVELLGRLLVLFSSPKEFQEVREIYSEQEQEEEGRRCPFCFE